MKTCRSWMFVPGHITKMVTKAAGVASDAIMLDIEDAVLPASKPQAREVIAQEVPKMAQSGQVRVVRVNAISTKDFPQDLEAIVGLNIDGIVLPKVESPEEVTEAAAALEKLERARGVKKPLELLLAIESAKGMFAAQQIAAASRRAIGLMLGAEDFGRDIGLPAQRTGEAYELIHARSVLVLAAAAARIQSVDQVWTNLSDAVGLAADAAQARRLGFTGKAIIHPGQAEPVNAAFTPSAADVEFANSVLRAFEEAEAKGLGAVAFGGQLLDKPIVERAQAVIAMSRQWGAPQ